MDRYRKMPVEVEAVQWDGTAEGATPIIDWILGSGGTATYICSDTDRCSVNDGDTPHSIEIRTLEGFMIASLDDWIIKGVQGEFYPCKPDVFAATYETADAKREPGGALIEVIERDATTQETGGNSVVVPNEVRINGTPLLVADRPITIHEIEIPARTGVRASDLAMVTLTLYARRVTIAAEGDLS